MDRILAALFSNPYSHLKRLALASVAPWRGCRFHRELQFPETSNRNRISAERVGRRTDCCAADAQRLAFRQTVLVELPCRSRPEIWTCCTYASSCNYPTAPVPATTMDEDEIVDDGKHMDALRGRSFSKDTRLISA